MPDSSIMLDLCNELKISVNELLSGEMIDMNNYNEIAENTLLEMAKIAGFTGLKFEVDAGYYECKNCHHKFVPTYKEAMFAIHLATTRHLKCSKCHKKSWAKKVMFK